MPISDRKFKKLTVANVERSPRKAGVYGLYAGKTLVYLGGASGPETIQSALRAHLDAPPSKATRYKRETSASPDARLKTLLAEHVAARGRPPVGNTTRS
jgi:hypothetical protein